MSPRRNGTSTFSPTSVIVEFHEFDGRWFVTDRWGSGSGVPVKRPVRKSALGKVVLDRVAAARSQWRAFITAADDAEHWARFCTSEAGVPPEDYLPEKRLVILAGKTGIQCRDALQSPPAWQPLPARSPRALGSALMKHMARPDLGRETAPPRARTGRSWAGRSGTPPPRPGSGSSSTSAPGCRPPATSTRSPSGSHRSAGSSTPTTTRSSWPMPARCSPPPRRAAPPTSTPTCATPRRS